MKSKPQSIRDPAEILFGRMGRFVGASNAAVFLATSTAWRPPDAISLVARSAPQRFSTRGRVSIGFEEAGAYGVGVRSEDDMEFWWSRAAYATKQTIVGSRSVATERGLLETPPFKEILPLIESVASALDTAEDVGAGILGGIGGAIAGFAVAGPVGAIAGAAAGAAIGQSIPDVTQEDAADLFSVITEGWWTGNAVQPRVAQKGAAAIAAYDAQTVQQLLFGERTHAWFPRNQFDDTRGPVAARCNHNSARWFFGRSRDGLVAVFSAREADWATSGPWKDREIRAEGNANVFVTQIGSAAEFGDFETFVARVSRARVHVSGLHTSAQLQCSYDTPGGERLELHYDDGPRYGGEALEDDNFPRHFSPFGRIAWRQDRYAIQHGARSLVHDIPRARRVMGGTIAELAHDTPPEIYAQNMALLPWPLYKGVDRDGATSAALGRLLAA